MSLKKNERRGFLLNRGGISPLSVRFQREPLGAGKNQLRGHGWVNGEFFP